MYRRAALVAFAACTATAAGQGAESAAAPAPLAKPACTRSVVLVQCDDARAGADPKREQLRERLQRNARRLEQRATLSPTAGELAPVIIEEQRTYAPSDLERFRETLTQPSHPFGRNEYAGVRGDRDNFGMRFECGQSWDLMCANQAGRAASEHWMNGR